MGFRFSDVVKTAGLIIWCVSRGFSSAVIDMSTFAYPEKRYSYVRVEVGSACIAAVIVEGACIIGMMYHQPQIIQDVLTV